MFLKGRSINSDNWRSSGSIRFIPMSVNLLKLVFHVTVLNFTASFTTPQNFAARKHFMACTSNYQEETIFLYLEALIPYSVMKLVSDVLDIEFSLNLVGSQFISSSWATIIKTFKDQNWSGCTREKLSVSGVILLQVRVGDIKVRA